MFMSKGHILEWQILLPFIWILAQLASLSSYNLCPTYSYYSTYLTCFDTLI